MDNVFMIRNMLDDIRIILELAVDPRALKMIVRRRQQARRQLMVLGLLFHQLVIARVPDLGPLLVLRYCDWVLLLGL
jgi:hypothetical protein